MKRIAVLTSGGDAPGMNAAIRAVVRGGVARGMEAFGVRYGYAGLMADNMIPLGPRDVGGIIGRGGTILGSARAPEFRTEAGRMQALHNLNARGIEGLVVIGGNGSQAGAAALAQMGFAVVGVASTIDNDLVGSDITIGVDTALEVALEAVDRLKVTASSHGRAFLIEVMGRGCGYLALMTGLAGGAEAIVIPEVETDPEEIAGVIRESYEHGKPHAVVVVAEGAKLNAAALMSYFGQHQERLGFEVRATILGHVQRGDDPTASDRVLATQLGAAAVEQLAQGQSGVLVGMIQGQVVATPYAEVLSGSKPIDLNLLALAQMLNR